MTCDIVDDLLKVVSGLKRTEEMKIALKDVEIALRTVESAKQTKDEIGVCRSCIEAQCDSCANIERELDDAESQLNKVITKAITEVTTYISSNEVRQRENDSVPMAESVSERCRTSLPFEPEPAERERLPKGYGIWFEFVDCLATNNRYVRSNRDTFKHEKDFAIMPREGRILVPPALLG